MMKSRAEVLDSLKLYFGVDSFTLNSLEVLHRGRYANAVVFRYQDGKHDLVIKDFTHSPWMIRLTLGRLFIAREERNLDRLKGIRGIAPYACRLGKWTLAYPYIEGASLKELGKRGERLPVTFFHELEQLVAEMHQRGVVHLDLRNSGNVLCGADGHPYLIDFQSALRGSLLPHGLHRLLRCADLTGVYKSWLALSDTPLSSLRQRLWIGFNQVRRFWIFRGYPLSR